MATAIYLFCFSNQRCLDLPEVSGTAPADGLFLYRRNGVYAVARRVEVEEFCGADAGARLEDAAWVTPRAVEHGRVIAEAFRGAPVLPARFATLFSSEKTLDEFIARNVIAIGGFLADARAREEWGVKGILDRVRLQAYLAANIAGGNTDSVAPGLRYLQERRAARAAEKQASSWLEQACESAAAAISEYAVEIRQRGIVDGAPAADAETILNLAAFVPRERVTDLRRRIDELNAQLEAPGLSFALTGPWPPYSFCPPLQATP